MKKYFGIYRGDVEGQPLKKCLISFGEVRYECIPKDPCPIPADNVHYEMLVYRDGDKFASAIRPRKKEKPDVAKNWTDIAKEIESGTRTLYIRGEDTGVDFFLNFSNLSDFDSYKVSHDFSKEDGYTCSKLVKEKEFPEYGDSKNL
ncbi:MAG: hypothetical protein ACXVAJ_08175 [Parachlamydiaceae bacterium]